MLESYLRKNILQLLLPPFPQQGRCLLGRVGVLELVGDLVIVNAHLVLAQVGLELLHHALPREPAKVALHSVRLVVNAERVEELLH